MKDSISSLGMRTFRRARLALSSLLAIKRSSITTVRQKTGVRFNMSDVQPSEEELVSPEEKRLEQEEALERADLRVKYRLWIKDDDEFASLWPDRDKLESLAKERQHAAGRRIRNAYESGRKVKFDLILQEHGLEKVIALESDLNNSHAALRQIIRRNEAYSQDAPPEHLGKIDKKIAESKAKLSEVAKQRLVLRKTIAFAERLRKKAGAGAAENPK